MATTNLLLAMTEQVIESSTKLLELIFQYEFGSDYFYTLMGSTLVILFGITWLLARNFGSKAGLFKTAIAVMLPLLLGVFGYVMMDIFLAPKLETLALKTYMPWVGFGLVSLLTLLVLTKKMLGQGAIVTIMIVTMATFAAGIAYYGADVHIKMADKGSERSKQPNTRAIDQIVD